MIAITIFRPFYHQPGPEELLPARRCYTDRALPACRPAAESGWNRAQYRVC